MNVNGTNYGSAYKLEDTPWIIKELEDADSGLLYRYEGGQRREINIRFAGIDAHETRKDYYRVEQDISIYSHQYIEAQDKYGQAALGVLKKILAAESSLATDYSITEGGKLKKPTGVKISDDGVTGRQLHISLNPNKDDYNRLLVTVATPEGKNLGISLQEQLVAAGVVEVSAFQNEADTQTPEKIEYINNLLRLQNKAISEGRSLFTQPYSMSPSQFRTLMDQEVFFDRNPFYQVLRQGKYLKSPGKKNIKEGKEGLGPVYLPTSLDDDFQKKYARPNIYRDFFAVAGLNRNDKLMASGYQKRLIDTADRQLSFRMVTDSLKFVSSLFPAQSHLRAHASALAVGFEQAFLDVYEPGEGFIGTGVRGVGRFLDTITGFYALREERLRRKGDFDGGFQKLHRNFQNEREKHGIFERLLTGVTNTAATTAASLGFYFGVTHTVSVARAHIEDIGVDYIASILSTPDRFLKSALLPNEVINLFQGLDTTTPGVNIGQELHHYSTFLVAESAQELSATSSATSSTPGTSITKVDIDEFYTERNISDTDRTLLQAKYGSTSSSLPAEVQAKREEIKTRLKRQITEQLNTTSGSTVPSSGVVSKVETLKKVQSDVFSIDYDAGELDISQAGRTSAMPYRGWMANIGNLRRIDKSNYDNIVRPILEQIAIAPGQEAQKFRIALDNLGKEIAKAPVILFKRTTGVSGGASAFLDSVEIKNYGYDRLEKIASQLDEVARYIPANPLLYFKPFREAAGVTNLRVELGGGIVEDYSLKQLIGPGFSGLTKFTRNIIRGLTSQTDGSGIIRQFANNTELFAVERELLQLEKQFKNITIKLTKPPRGKGPSPTHIQNTFADAKYLLGRTSDATALRDFADSLVGAKGLVNNLFRDNEFFDTAENYNLKYKRYQQLLQNTPNYSLATEQDVPSVYKNIRGLLFTVGPLMILDRVLDPYVMRAQGIDLITQIFLDHRVLTQKYEEEGKVQSGQIEYKGIMPNYVRYSTMTAGYLAGGILVPSFSAHQRAAGSVIARTIDEALGSSVPVEDIISNSGTKEALLKRALQNTTNVDSQNVFNQLPITRVRTRFGYFGAFVGAVAAVLVMQTVFDVAAGTLNFLNSARRKEGSRPDQASLAQGLRLSSAAAAVLNKRELEGLNRYQIALLQTAQQISQSALHGRKRTPRQVYTFAHQIPNPIFQLTTVSKIDQQGNTVAFGAGFQFLPILGSGSIPPSPFEVNLRPVETIRSSVISELKERKERGLKLSKQEEQVLELEGLGFWFSLLSFPGHLLSISKDTTFSQAISFIGAASYLAAGTEAAEEFLKANATESLKKELRQVKPFYQMVKGFSSSFETLLRYSQVPSLALGNAIMKSTTSFFGVDEKVFTKIGPKARAAAPYVLAYIFASAATGPGGFFNDSEKETYSNAVTAQLTRFSLVVAPITAIYGYGLHEAGVFARADSFISPAGSTAASISDGFMAKKKALLGEIAQQYPSDIPPLVRTSAVRLSMASRRIFTISVILAAIGLTARGAIGESLPFLDLVADAGDPQKTKEQRAYEQYLGTNKRKYRPENLGDSALAMTDYLFRSATAVFGFDSLFYQDNPNPFISLAGSIGFTQTDKGQVRVYQQAQSSFADISGSSYEVINLILTESLAQSFLHALGVTEKDVNYDDASAVMGLLVSRYYELRAPVNRKVPASAKNWISSDESQQVQGIGLVAAIAHKMNVIENLRNQSARELAIQMTLEGNLRGGNVSNIKELSRIWTPLSNLGSLGVHLRSPQAASNVLALINQFAQNRLDSLNLGLNISDGFLERVQTGEIDNTNRQSIINYYAHLGSTVFSDRQSFAARLAIIPMLVSVGLFSLGSTLVFATNILAATAAYNQGATVTSLERILDEKINYFASRKRIDFGFGTNEGALLFVQPLQPNKVKPLELTASAGFFTRGSFNNAQLTAHGDDIALQIKAKFRGHYEQVENFLNLRAKTAVVATGSKLTYAQSLYNSLDDLVFKTAGSAVVDPVRLVSTLKDYTKSFLEVEVPYGTGTSGGKAKLFEILGITDEVKAGLIGSFDQITVQIQSVLDETNLSQEAKLRKIQGIIGAKFQDLDSRIFSSATASYQSDKSLMRGVSGVVGTKKTIVKVGGRSILTTSQIIQSSGYLGLAKEGVVGLTKVLGKISDITLFLELSSFLTKAAVETSPLERERALIAAGITVGKLLPYFAVLATMKFIVPNLLVAGTFASFAAITVALDNSLNEGKLVKASVSYATNLFRKIERTAKPLTDFGSRATYNFFRTLVTTPGTREALAIIGVPFRLLDPVIENIWQKSEGIMGLYYLLNFFVPSSVDTIYNLYMSDRPFNVRGEPRMYMFTRREQEQDLANRLGRARLKALSLDFTPDIHPNLLGRPSGAREEFIKSIYFDSAGGTPRVLEDFDLTPAVSGSLLVALKANQAAINHYVYASFTRRHQLLPGGLDVLYTFTAGYLKSSIGAHGNYRGLLEKTVETIKSAATTINNFFGTHKLRLYSYQRGGYSGQIGKYRLNRTFFFSRVPLALSSAYTGHKVGKLIGRIFGEEQEDHFGFYGSFSGLAVSSILSLVFEARPIKRTQLVFRAPATIIPVGRRLIQGLVGTLILSAVTYAFAELLDLDDKTKTQLLQTSIGVGAVSTNVLTLHSVPRHALRGFGSKSLNLVQNLLSSLSPQRVRWSFVGVTGFIGYFGGSKLGKEYLGEEGGVVSGVVSSLVLGSISAIGSDPKVLSFGVVQKVIAGANKTWQFAKNRFDTFRPVVPRLTAAAVPGLILATVSAVGTEVFKNLFPGDQKSQKGADYSTPIVFGGVLLLTSLFGASSPRSLYGLSQATSILGRRFGSAGIGFALYSTATYLTLSKALELATFISEEEKKPIQEGINWLSSGVGVIGFAKYGFSDFRHFSNIRSYFNNARMFSSEIFSKKPFIPSSSVVAPAYAGRLKKVAKSDLNFVKNILTSKTSQGVILNVLTGVAAGSLFADLTGSDKEESMQVGGIVGLGLSVIRNVFSMALRKKAVGGGLLPKRFSYNPRSIFSDAATFSLLAIPAVTTLIGKAVGGELGAVFGAVAGLAIDAFLISRYTKGIKPSGPIGVTIRGAEAVKHDLRGIKNIAQPAIKLVKDHFPKVLSTLKWVKDAVLPGVREVSTTGAGVLIGAGIGYTLGAIASGALVSSGMATEEQVKNVPLFGAVAGGAINLLRYGTYSAPIKEVGRLKASVKHQTYLIKFLSKILKEDPSLKLIFQPTIEGLRSARAAHQAIIRTKSTRFNLLKKDFSFARRNFLPILDTVFLGFGLYGFLSLPEEESAENYRISYSNFFSTFASSFIYSTVGLFFRSPTAALTIIEKASPHIDEAGRWIGELRKRDEGLLGRTAIDVLSIAGAGAAVTGTAVGVRQAFSAAAKVGAQVGPTGLTKFIAGAASASETIFAGKRAFYDGYNSQRDSGKYIAQEQVARKLAEGQVKDTFAALTVLTTKAPPLQIGITLLKSFTEETLTSWRSDYYDRRLSEARVTPEDYGAILEAESKGAQYGAIGGLIVGTGIVIGKALAAVAAAVAAGGATVAAAPAVITGLLILASTAILGSLAGRFFGAESEIDKIKNEKKQNESNLINPRERVGARNSQAIVAMLGTDTPPKIFGKPERESVEVERARRLADKHESKLVTMEQKKNLWERELPTVYKLTADEDYLLDDNLFVRGLKFGAKLLLSGGLVIISILGKVFSAIGDYFKGSRRDLRQETEVERAKGGGGTGQGLGDEVESSSDPFYSGIFRSISSAFKSFVDFILPSAGAAQLPGGVPSGQRSNVRRQTVTPLDRAPIRTTSGRGVSGSQSPQKFYILDSDDRPNIDWSADSTVSLQMYRQKAAEFGINTNLITSGIGQRGGRTHYGVDIVAPNNLTSIFEYSKVVFAESQSGYGNRIKIAELRKNPDGTFSETGRAVSYGHLSAMQVKPGEIIEGGRLLGVIGDTGDSTGIHHHVEQHQKNSSGSYDRVVVQSSVIHATIAQGILVDKHRKDDAADSKLLPQLSGQYESLNALATELSRYRQFDVNDPTGRAALGMALVIAELEVGAGKLNESNFFTLMGGSGNLMRGFAQFNTGAGWDEITRTQDGYVNLLGYMLTGVIGTPSGKSRFNIEGLTQAIETRQIKNGADLEQWILNQSNLTKDDWEPLFDNKKIGTSSFRPIFDQVVEYWLRFNNTQSTDTQPSTVAKTEEKGVVGVANIPVKEYAVVTPSKKILNEEQAALIAKETAGIKLEELQRITLELQEVRVQAQQEAEKIAKKIQERKVVGIDILEPAVVRKENLSDIPRPADEKLAKSYIGEMTVSKKRIDLIVTDEADDGYWVDQRATPFIVVKDEELTRLDSYNLSNLHSNFRSSPFGTAEGWESQQSS